MPNPAMPVAVDDADRDSSAARSPRSLLARCGRCSRPSPMPATRPPASAPVLPQTTVGGPSSP